MQTVNDIRRTFLDFFARHGHRVLPSSPLVPRNDPSLMFTNAGMVQFKNVFTGVEKRDYQRAVTAQKCVRAGGKHNDLENVGYTARHHTFFEMLGNFSFGDYFKDVAIELAWTLVTREFGLPPPRLLVTVFAEDDEAYDLWKKIAGLDERRIIRIPTSDNFWAMGDTGPCGPCSEIFYDHGAHIPGGPPGSTDADGDRFIEIWNLVFMQYEQLTPEKRIDLPRPSIDTGMGLERVAAVMQGTHDNYEIDLLQSLIHASADLTGTEARGKHVISHRVIADHLRAAAFLIADGVLPANEGRGYVLRRIMRRAMRHVHMIGYPEPLLWRLVPTLVSKMGQAYPELVRAEALIGETLMLEETRFRRTLDRGLRLLEDAIETLPPGGTLDGEVAFRLYDTYGFPLDLTQDALRARGIAVDTAGFDAAMARQRAEARKAWAGSGETATEAIWFHIREQKGATEFLGYETETSEGHIVAIVIGGEAVESAAAGQNVAVICNQTPFYGESGGQMGDVGTIVTSAGARVAVLDTVKRAGDLHVHTGVVETGTIAVGDECLLEVDTRRRSALRANHSATHLLHAALRRVLGHHVQQKGSYLDDQTLRFDFAHFQKVSDEELAQIEQIVNEKIRENIALEEARSLPIEEAQKAGAMMLFGEKYGERVRMITFDPAYSRELCGGCHVRHTGQIGYFKIVSESAVAAGVRRVEALTADAAEQYLANIEREALAIKMLLKTKEPAKAVADLLEENKRLQKEIERLIQAQANSLREGLRAQAETVNGVALVAAVLPISDANAVKTLAYELERELGNAVIAFGTVNADKPLLTVRITDALAKERGLNAGTIVRELAQKFLKGGGGGQPFFATAGGSDASQLAEAVQSVKNYVK